MNLGYHAHEPAAVTMSERRIIIVTGSVDSGKTSWCRELAAANPESAGVLLLKVYADSERIGYDALRLPVGDRIPFARKGGREPSDWTAAQQVGPFSISAAGLASVNAWLTEAAGQSRDIIIDEVGPLELAGDGLSPGLRAALASPLQRKLYVVIRSDCLEAACEHFGITDYAVKQIGPGQP